MRENSIIFSGQMVRAILDGRKSQTRRIVRPSLIESLDFLGGTQKEEDSPGIRIKWEQTAEEDGKLGKPQWLACCADYPEDGWVEIGAGPTCPNGRIWVRETWCQQYEDGRAIDGKAWYRADGIHVVKDDGDGFSELNKDGSEASPWRSPMFMPRWASRITLEATKIRIERLHDIGDEDAIAEGMPIDDARHDYEILWEKIHGLGWWAINPWVWVIEFKRLP